MTIIILSALGG